MNSAEFHPPGKLQPVIAGEKKRGRTIALVNGCFSLIHVGHVRYLQAAAAQADCLVVALNSDESVRRIKGPEKMILDQQARVTILRSFSAVDFVTVFEEETADKLLQLLKPDYHCKGEGYKSPEQVPEYSTVQSYGGKTLIVGGTKVHSTTQLLRKIKGSGDDRDRDSTRREDG
jgi:rfaE bifunctional protein nucleotidyltransferase chain/domain